jgi:hypothetical protein
VRTVQSSDIPFFLIPFYGIKPGTKGGDVLGWFRRHRMDDIPLFAALLLIPVAYAYLKK